MPRNEDDQSNLEYRSLWLTKTAQVQVGWGSELIVFLCLLDRDFVFC